MNKNKYNCKNLLFILKDKVVELCVGAAQISDGILMLCDGILVFSDCVVTFSELILQFNNVKGCRLFGKLSDPSAGIVHTLSQSGQVTWPGGGRSDIF